MGGWTAITLCYILRHDTAVILATSSLGTKSEHVQQMPHGVEMILSASVSVFALSDFVFFTVSVAHNIRNSV